MNRRTKISAVLFGFISLTALSQVNVDVNLNMKHSVNGVSNFGRERRMTIHSDLQEGDWKGHEDKLNYLINDLDVYFGRETGSATWKMQGVEEDPKRPGWPNEAQMLEHGYGLRQWYESDDYADRRPYEGKSNMIMGVNDFTPMYPNLSWYEGFGKGKGGWFVKDTDAAAEWVSLFLKYYYSTHPDSIGPELPLYWECYNEPDMNFMNPSFGMIVSSLEKNWEYHKRVAQAIRKKLGNKAPKIGGMTWGQLDLYKADGIASRSDGAFWYQNSSAAAGLLYDNMLSGVGSGIANPGVGNAVWPKAWANRTSEWWQWDYMYQGFIDFAGADMDFYGVHMYDWPHENVNNYKANTRGGGHIEAMLDMFEWYDKKMFGKTKDIVMSEFGAVSRDYILSLPTGERDWPFIKSFNQMQMQFLERPSHVVYSMPFAPVKAVWGATFSGNNVVRYEGATLMDPLGSWTGDAATWKMNEPTGGWAWSKIIHFFELWKDVEGTRIDTKADNNDIQVDAYVLGKHVYLILNNAIDKNMTLNLNLFGSSSAVTKAEVRHLYQGDDRIPKFTKQQLTSAPAQVSLKPNSTIVIDYTFANNVTVNQESKETKYMCDPLAGNQKNARGTQLCHTASMASITATVNGVQKPSKGEAIIRIGGFFANPLDGTDGMKVKKLTVNGNPVIVDADNFVANTRGYGMGNYKGSWFGVLELECPIEYLKSGQNTVYFERWQGAEYTTVMIQVFDMTAAPGRTTGGITNLAPTVNAGSDQTLAVGTTKATLIATASDPDGNTLTYKWTQVSGPAATISGATTLSASVTGLTNGNTYVFQFSANDGKATSTDQITVKVNSPANNAPTVNAGTDQSLAFGTTSATLNGTGSDPDGNAITYSWSQVSGVTATITNKTTATTTVTGLASGNTYLFRLTVSDGTVSSTDDVAITVASDPNATVIVIEAESFISTGGTYNDGQVPLGVNKAATTINWVNSGDYADYTINVGKAGTYKIEYLISTPMDNAQIQIAFDGTTASTDNVVNSGQWDTYQSLVASKTVTLTAGSHNVRISATGSNTWQWNLDKVNITLQSSSNNTAPVANAGTDQTLAAGTTTASLNGSGIDANGDALTYAWTVVSGTATITNAASAKATVSGLSNGKTYVFRLTVSDGKLTATDDVKIIVSTVTTTCGLPYSNAGFSVTKATKNWTSGAIDISCASSVNVSVTIEGVGPMEAADYLNVYYKLNGGTQKVISENTNAFSSKTVSASNISGSTIEILINGKTSWDDETYNVSNITVTSNGSTTTPTPVELVIEAEKVSNTGGTYNDGFVPVGPGIQAGVGLYWVNNGDWAEYNVNIPESGEYKIVYNIATPLSNRSIEILSDGVSLNKTTVPNTGNWETYQSLTASSNANFTVGNHVIRLQPGTADIWAWNLDKFTLTRLGALKSGKVAPELTDNGSMKVDIYPNPAINEVNISITNSELAENRLDIYNSQGVRVVTDIIVSDDIYTLDVSGWTKGLYLVQTNGSQITRLLLK